MDLLVWLSGNYCPYLRVIISQATVSHRFSTATVAPVAY